MEKNFQSVNEALNQAVASIKNAISLSMDDINKDHRNEQKYIDLWTENVKKVIQYFTLESERTGNQHLVRNIRKSVLKNIKLFNILPVSKFRSD